MSLGVPITPQLAMCTEFLYFSPNKLHCSHGKCRDICVFIGTAILSPNSVLSDLIFNNFFLATNMD